METWPQTWENSSDELHVVAQHSETREMWVEPVSEKLPGVEAVWELSEMRSLRGEAGKACLVSECNAAPGRCPLDC